jgi:hypothetical protein
MSRMRWMTGALAGLGVLALAATDAAAQSAQDDNRTAKFRELDRNGNGSLDRGEYGGHPGNFRALDQNKDGGLSLDEFVHRQGVRPEEPPRPPEAVRKDLPLDPGVGDEFAVRDLNRNGLVDRNEWPDHPEFTRRDANRDDQLTRDEYFGGVPRQDARDVRFDRMDRNRDGWVSRNEWKGGTRTFQRTDINGDGVITRDEYLR